jgi:hypothetical protein
MAAVGGGQGDYSSPELSSPPSRSISDPGSPSRPPRTSTQMDEIVVGTNSATRFGIVPNQQQPVRLTKDGRPRQKPGRKPGTVVKPKDSAADGGPAADGTKVRRPRKPRDPNGPPVQRKRKLAPTGTESFGEDSKSLAAAAAVPSGQVRITDMPGITSSESRLPSGEHQFVPQKMPKREPLPNSMQAILNAEPATPTNTTLTMRSSGQSYDPVRGNYDPVRETMVTRNPYGDPSISSPRAPSTQIQNRASASPSIASLVDPPVHNTSMVSPVPSHTSFHNTATQSRMQPPEPTSMPTSPSHVIRPPPLVTKVPILETKRPPPPPPVPISRMESRPKEVAPTSNPAPAKKPSPKEKVHTAASSPKVSNLDDLFPPAESGRSILDFGKAKPGEELQAPSIILHVPIKEGETNKYVNFMRLAEEQYGWDALHPRQASQRDRKARIAAAAAALEKAASGGSGKESGDDMSVDLSEEASNPEVGGTTSGVDVPVKPKKKKRNFKEDEYDPDDGFVDDSELLWEQQAAASRDGFFVYSGPLVQEPEKPPALYVLPFPYFGSVGLLY